LFFLLWGCVDGCVLCREECACNPVRFFCIVSMQRSGSGWFETFLNSHINVSSNGEIFSVGKRRTNVSSILETMDQVYNLDWFSSASKNECSAAVGFKWMLNQVHNFFRASLFWKHNFSISYNMAPLVWIQGLMEHHEEIGEYFERRRVSIIFLFRRNLLRRMISVLANAYDKGAKALNGTHKSHVHSPLEVSTFRFPSSFVQQLLCCVVLTSIEKWFSRCCAG